MLIEINANEDEYTAAQVRFAVQELVEEMGGTAKEVRPVLLKRPKDDAHRIAFTASAVSLDTDAGYSDGWMTGATVEAPPGEGFYILPDAA